MISEAVYINRVRCLIDLVHMVYAREVCIQVIAVLFVKHQNGIGDFSESTCHVGGTASGILTLGIVLQIYNPLDTFFFCCGWGSS